MKKVIIFIILILGLGGFFWVGQKKSPSENVPFSPTSAPTTAESLQIIDFEIEDVTYRAAWVKTGDFKNLFLYPNFEKKLSAQELFGNKDCRILVSAGFYTEDYKPIGLFISEGEKIKNRIESRLFDGVFSVGQDGKASIGWETPPETVRLALQSGPVVIKDGKALDLKIVDDKSARRVVLTFTREGEAYFLIIYNKDSVLEGPYLADLPVAVKNIEDKMNTKFWDGINLDGGSASAFYTAFLSLSEFSTIGSYFCLK